MEKFIDEIYLKHLKGEISRTEAKELLAQFFTEIYIQHEFERITKNQDAKFLDVFIDLMNLFNRDEVFLYYFHELLMQTWHSRHEIIIESISSFKSNSSVKFIVKALDLKIEYLVDSETDYNSFIRKCMWTLADINSPESIEQLNKYLSSENAVIVSCAKEQIRWLSGEQIRFMW